MSAVEPSLSGGVFHTAFAEGAAPTMTARARLLATLTAGTLLIDAAVVLGGFLLAYWVRFVVPDVEAAALSPHEYARIGLLVSVLTVPMLAFQGVYRPHRRLTWPGRLYVVVSGIS